MSRITIRGFITTSDAVQAYGGVALAPETMYYIANEIRQGKMPLHSHHNERYLLDPQILLVDVRETSSGSLGVWIEFEIDEQEWKEHGNLGGFSIAVTSDHFEPNPNSTKPVLKIYADAGHYSEVSFRAAIARLERHFAVGGGRLYQFNILPPAKIIIDFALATVQAIPPNILSSWLYDGLKVLLQKPKNHKAAEPLSESVTCIRITSENQQIDLFQIQTNDPEVLKAGLSTFYSNLSPKQKESGSLPKTQEHFSEFDSKSRKWKRLR
jgi:hypothetical protein